jgi:hypothetical protein
MGHPPPPKRQFIQTNTSLSAYTADKRGKLKKFTVIKRLCIVIFFVPLFCLSILTMLPVILVAYIALGKGVDPFEYVAWVFKKGLGLDLSEI